MSELIRKQNAIDIGMAITALELFGNSEHLPSAQPDIIRCKDCIHKYDHDCPIDWDKTDSDYCSFAERRTDETD